MLSSSESENIVHKESYMYKQKDVFFSRIGAREMKGGADRTQRYKKLEILVLKIFFVD